MFLTFSDQDEDVSALCAPLVAPWWLVEVHIAAMLSSVDLYFL